MRTWRIENTKERHAYLLKKYGISVEEYDRMFQLQNGVCAICKKVSSDKRLCVDHCHETNKIRGLLCYRCNYGIGLLNDNSDRIRVAAEYLEKFN